LAACYESVATGIDAGRIQAYSLIRTTWQRFIVKAVMNSKFLLTKLTGTI
jgi:hypothetical protein